MAKIVEFLGNEVQGKNGNVETASFCGEDKYVGFYFSAHWCPPCRMFTPELREFYEKFKSSGNDKKLEIVFISSDQSQEQFDEYYAVMPWLALPFIQRDQKTKLCTEFGVSGIPTLVILNTDSGVVVRKDGSQDVTDDPDGKKFPWNK